MLPYQPWYLSQTGFGQRCQEFWNERPWPSQPWYLSQTPMGQRAQAFWNEKPCAPHPWNVAASPCLNPLYEWVTYRPLPQRKLCDSGCGCQKCAPCCDPPGYWFFLDLCSCGRVNH
jgi:hypothetical protein